MRKTIHKTDLRWWRFQIRELHWQGLSSREIGRRIGRDNATVLYHLRAGANDSPAPHLVYRGAGI
jgi:IS30 family transposase